MPKTPDDPCPPLIGSKDVSVPVHNFEGHTTGDGNDWLFAENGFPWELRRGGWVYLRNEGRLGARARVRGIGFRAKRRYHTGIGEDGPGPTIEVDRESWEPVDIDLGDLADSQRQGYRYLITTVGGDVIHLTAGDPIPPEVDVDPPSSSA